jgi:hypothetical protein
MLIKQYRNIPDSPWSNARRFVQNNNTGGFTIK